MVFSLIRKSIIPLVFLACCASANMFRGNYSRSGQVNSVITPPFKQIHTATINALIVSSPIVINDTVYIGARDSSVYALYNGELVWKFKTRGWIDASPVYSNGKIYAGSRDGNLYILNAQNGDSVGVIVNNNTQCSTPLIYDSLIVFGRGGWCKNINAYNVNNGKYVWHYENIQMVYSSPALSDSILCYGENGGSLVALNAHTGSLIWKYQTEGGVYLASPAISNSMVYLSPGDYDLYIYALSLANGSLIWKSRDPTQDTTKYIDNRLVKSILRSGPAKRNRIVDYYRKTRKMSRAQIRTLKPLTEEKNRADEFVPFGGCATSSVAVGDSNVFVVRMAYGYPKPQFSMLAFDKISGAVRWTFSEMRNCEMLGFCSSPLVLDTVVLFGWGEGKVYAYHTLKGTKLWEDSLDGDILSSPAAEGDKIYVATTTGKIVTYTPGPELVSFTKSTFCYPNPARGNVSHIQIYVTKSTTVKVTIYNANEKPVLRFSKRLTVEPGTEGTKYTYEWNIKDIANGVYFAVIDGGGNNKKTLKIAVLH